MSNGSQIFKTMTFFLQWIFRRTMTFHHNAFCLDFKRLFCVGGSCKNTFNQDGSSVEMIGAEHSPGIEVMTGSLGQGLSQAAGLAMARKRRGESGRVWVFMSDGELQSGQNWEAMQAIAFHRLDNLRIIVDVNQQQCDGAVDQVMKTEPLDERLAAFGARVRRVDGHNIEQLAELAELKPDGRPLVILADTDPCAGIELLQARAPKLHYIRFSSPEEQQTFAAALAEL